MIALGVFGFLASSCSVPLPEPIVGAAEQLPGPIRVSWYLSPQLSDNGDLKIIDAQLGFWARSLNRESSSLVSALLVEPEAGQPKPEYLLPVPGWTHRNEPQTFWAGLVIDWRGYRIVIPDTLDPVWFPLDFLRALEDLARGEPMKIAYLNGAPSLGGLPLGFLNGRWRVKEWKDGLPLPEGSDVILVRDGPRLDQDSGYLAAFLQAFAEGGGGVLVAPSDLPDGNQPLSGWARQNSGPLGNGRILFVDDVRILNVDSYERGENSLRILDSVLLAAAGRDSVLSLFPASAETSRRPGIHSRRAGKRLEAAAPLVSDLVWPGTERINRLVFGKAFSLERRSNRNSDDWDVVSGDWRLPARVDRIESFLERMESSVRTAWEVDANLTNPRVPIRFETDGKQSLHLQFSSIRQSGGGFYASHNNDVYVLNRLNADEISGDSRYFTELRLFPDIAKTAESQVILLELHEGTSLRWRLHLSGDEWQLTGPSGSKTGIAPNTAREFALRISRMEALAAFPETSFVSGSDSMRLRLETSRGKSVERVVEYQNGERATAFSPDGIGYLLNDIETNLILHGPFRNNQGEK